MHKFTARQPGTTAGLQAVSNERSSPTLQPPRAPARTAAPGRPPALPKPARPLAWQQRSTFHLTRLLLLLLLRRGCRAGRQHWRGLPHYRALQGQQMVHTESCACCLVTKWRCSAALLSSSRSLSC